MFSNLKKETILDAHVSETLIKAIIRECTKSYLKEKIYKELAESPYSILLDETLFFKFNFLDIIKLKKSTSGETHYNLLKQKHFVNEFNTEGKLKKNFDFQRVYFRSKLILVANDFCTKKNLTESIAKYTFFKDLVDKAKNENARNFLLYAMRTMRDKLLFEDNIVNNSEVAYFRQFKMQAWGDLGNSNIISSCKELTGLGSYLN